MSIDWEKRAEGPPTEWSRSDRLWYWSNMREDAARHDQWKWWQYAIDQWLKEWQS